ncbi:MAG TPA: HD domain-containing protein [Syntrophorhabdaceae bacterium]|mgnify:CR=1 FL=1|nr:HD domain-containing protein [Syntrophorhabdaceae bacterium]HQM80088.1 HD domain-containing protein [Syntrophorhabdaceae bacterium]
MIDIPKSALNWMMRPRLFFLIQLLLFVAIFSGAFHVEYRHFMDEMKNTARSNHATGVQLSNLILKHQQAIVGIMRSYGARKLMVKAIQERDIEAVTGYFVGMRKEMPELDIVFISDARGTIWANYPRNAESIGKNFSYRDWYINTSRQWKPHISGVYKRVVGTNDLAVAITVPVFDEKGHPVAILGASQATVFIESVIETSVDDDALKVTLVDQSGNIVYSKKAAERKEVTRYTYPISGDTIAAYMPVRPLMWTIVVEKEKKAILASIFNHSIHTGVTSLALYMFIGLALILIRKYVVFEQAFALLAAEEKIRESEERHRVVIEQTGQLVYDYDVRSDKVVVSGAITHITGYTQDETSFGKNFWREHIHQDDREAVLNFLLNVTKGNVSNYRIRYRFRRKDGSCIHVEDSGVCMNDAGGRTYRILGAIEDVTFQQQAEASQKALIEELKKTIEGTVEALAATSEIRDPYTAGHQRRVTQLACAVAGEMGLAADAIDKIRIASLLHDVGKISIPAEILSKPARLNEYEFSITKLHAEAGYDILKNIKFPWNIAEIVFQHHERLDGSGYPRALQNGDILLEARIIAVADVVEAMASHRPYRPALGIDAALDEITRNVERLYDSDVVGASVRIFKERGFRFE